MRVTHSKFPPLVALLLATLAPAFGQTNSQTLEELVTITSAPHAFMKPLREVLDLPSPDMAKVAERFEPALTANTKLTDDQKAFVRKHYSDLVPVVNEKLLAASARHFQLGLWLKDFLRDSYTRQLTAREMADWVTYFKTGEGNLTLAAVTSLPQPTDPASVHRLHTFEGTNIGKKFIAIFGDQLNSHIQARIEAAGPLAKAEFESIMSPVELNKVVDEFVIANYKKP